MALKIVRLGGTGASTEGAPVEPAPAPADSGTPSLTGPLGGSAALRLLMVLFAEARTGRLLIATGAGAPRALVIARGEPAYAVVDDNGKRLAQRLTTKNALKPPGPTPGRAPRHPIAALTRRSDPMSVFDALREEVRALVLELLAAPMGQFAFYDDERALDSAPLTPLHPFAVLLEERRRATPPEKLVLLDDELGPRFVIPQPELVGCGPRLARFSGGVDLGAVVDGTRTVREVLRDARLDPMMGGLVLLTLKDAGLIDLGLTKVPPQQKPKRPHTAAPLPASAMAPVGPMRGGEELLALYLEIKPETDDNAVLGVEGSAGVAVFERAYQQRLAELDARAVPEGPNRPFLLARLEELRAKIERVVTLRTASRTRPRSTSAYQVLDRIGVGGMAEVFRGVPADDPTHFIAIKVVLPELRDDPTFAQMFLEEARLARRIRHPNVVQVLSVGRGSEDLYLAMEYIDGLDLGELLRRAREQNAALRVDVMCRILAQACAGLHAAHTATDRTGTTTAILHRDVSLQNILVSRTGEVKLSDFGIAKARDSATDDEARGGIKGKIPYLAPELLRGEPASVASDVYAMAMTAYAALGKLPFQRGERIDTMRAILNDPLPPLSSMAPGVPPILDALLATAAHRDPKQRHQSALELQLELEEILSLLPPVDVASWARPLAGARGDPGAPMKPITSIRSSTGLTSGIYTPIDPLKGRSSLPPQTALPGVPPTPAPLAPTRPAPVLDAPAEELDLDDL